jgi:DNA-binding HxlR family transcriptional regulator
MAIRDQVKRIRYSRKPNKTGRNNRGERYVRLEHWLLNTSAWKALTPQARAVYVELEQRFNGSNNGEISFSVREASAAVNIAKDTASKVFHELEEKGFIRRHVCGSFDWKIRHATTWVLTKHQMGDQPATKEFARWTQKNSEPGPNSGSNCPKSRTVFGNCLRHRAQTVLRLGPWTRLCTPDRSQTTARI